MKDSQRKAMFANRYRYIQISDSEKNRIQDMLKKRSEYMDKTGDYHTKLEDVVLKDFKKTHKALPIGWNISHNNMIYVRKL